LLWSAPLVNAQINTEELEQGPGPVVFINYDGPYTRIETLAQIRNIGYAQGREVRAGTGRTGSSARYFVIHSISGPDGTKLDADIFGLGVDVGVDHIRNLRLIIQGFLEGAYGYSPADASLLAEYITIYNAVFRGNWDFFNNRYKIPVIQNLSPEKTGLSIRVDEWPGQALIVIPLALGTPGSLSAIDTSTLTEPQVIDNMRQEQEDMGVGRRQEMVDLKEREAGEAEQSAVLQRDRIAQEEQLIARERQELAAEREQLEQERRQQANEPAPAETAEGSLAAREDAADQKEAELDQREAALEEQRETAAKTEERAEQKAAEAQQERQDIAQDQQAMIVRGDNREPPPPTTVGVALKDAASSLGSIVRVNTASGDVLGRSTLDTVNARTMTTVDGRLILIGGGSGAIRILEIDQGSLETVNQGNDDIHPQSLLWVNGTGLYAITVSGGSLYLARFNTDLVLQARSTVTVHPWASVMFQGDLIITQRTDGSVAILNGGDLTERK
jgi:hypothetical protein